MTTNPYEFRVDERLPDQTHEACRDMGAGVATLHWTEAHRAVAVFLGECFAVGGLLGLATELIRPVRGQRHG
jgi:hypothetical protein